MHLLTTRSKLKALARACSAMVGEAAAAETSAAEAQARAEAAVEAQIAAERQLREAAEAQASEADAVQGEAQRAVDAGAGAEEGECPPILAVPRRIREHRLGEARQSNGSVALHPHLAPRLLGRNWSHLPVGLPGTSM